ncbi:hypothetical protein ACVI1J_008981 [Bradyrhizobium diazoefficiens]
MVKVNDYLNVPDALMQSYRGLLNELWQEANDLQPWQPDEFDQRSAAIHEASHCVVVAREGYTPKDARVFQSDGIWLGDFHIDWPEATMRHDVGSPEFFAHLRIILAGRRGELLFLGDKFCLRAGLDELTYALMMIMPAIMAQTDGDRKACHELYGSTWETLLADIDETLFSHRQTVMAIAKKLTQKGSLRSRKLSQLVAPVQPRSAQPPLRMPDELHVAYDPLAYPASDSRRAGFMRNRSRLR